MRHIMEANEFALGGQIYQLQEGLTHNGSAYVRIRLMTRRYVGKDKPEKINYHTLMYYNVRGIERLKRLPLGSNVIIKGHMDLLGKNVLLIARDIYDVADSKPGAPPVEFFPFEEPAEESVPKQSPATGSAEALEAKGQPAQLLEEWVEDRAGEPAGEDALLPPDDFDPYAFILEIVEDY